MLVAHFSDLHLLDLTGVRPCSFLGKRLTGGVNLVFNRGGEFPVPVARRLVEDVRAQHPDHIVVSGDLTNLAFRSELELVRDLLLQLGPAEHVTVVPGNHDYYTLASYVRDDFARVMEPFLRADERPGPGPYPSLRLRDGLAIVALNSAHPSPPFIAWGTLGREQIDRARDLLGGESCRDRFRLVVLHHPPHAEHARWDNRLRDREAFVHMLAEVGAELVVHGHLHRQIRQELDGPSGPIPVLGVGSGTWLGGGDSARRARYNLYTIEGRRLTGVRTRRLDAAGQGFEPVG